MISQDPYVLLFQIAEQCNLSWLNISFCYKVSPQNIEIMISLLRAKGTLHTFEAMGIDVTVLAMEMVQSTRCLTRLSLCGIPALTDQRLEQVKVVTHNTIPSTGTFVDPLPIIDHQSNRGYSD